MYYHCVDTLLMTHFVHTIQEIKRLNAELKVMEMNLMLLDCTTDKHVQFQGHQNDLRQQRSRLMQAVSGRQRN